MAYCRVCHRQKPADHFEMYPDHNAQGPKRTLANIYADDEGADEGEGLHLGANSHAGPLVVAGALVVGLVALLVAAARSAA